MGTQKKEFPQIPEEKTLNEPAPLVILVGLGPLLNSKNPVLLKFP